MYNAKRSEAARKANVTRRTRREAAKKLQAAQYEHRDQLFESMTADQMNGMTEKLDAIKYEYEQRMEEFEEELLSELHEQFVGVKDEYSYDVVKSYVESDFNGTAGFRCSLDLNDWADEYEEETSFETEAEIATRHEAEKQLAGFLERSNAAVANAAVADAPVAQFDARGNFVGTN